MVTYDDATGDPKMTAAISEAVSAWNASTAPVVLVPSATNAALVFHAVNGKATLPVPSLNRGTYTFQVNYSGDGTFAANSVSITQAVTFAPTATVLPSAERSRVG